MTDPTPELLEACAHHIPTVKADAHEAWLVCSCGMQSYRSGQTWSEWWVNHMASFVQEREQAARLDERERCYQVARGPEDRFDKLEMHPDYKEKGNSLGRFIEECGEALTAAGKTVRYGWDSYNPELPPSQRETNSEWLRREITDVLFAINRLAKIRAWTEIATTPKEKHEHTPLDHKQCCSCGWICSLPSPVLSEQVIAAECARQHAEHVKEQK